ncbi:MAG: glycosyltransferase family 2 protein [Nitriliruptorales bacterium]
MQHSQPLVSIGLPVYNGASYLDRAIATILAQDLSDFELIISDNGSTDASPDIARSYAREDPRVRFLRSEQNRGASWNFNRVVELASGPYFKWVAHDDEHAPTYLSRCVAALEAQPGAVLSHTQTVTIDAAGRSHGIIDESFAVAAEKPHERWRQLLRYRGGCYHVFGVVPTDVMRQTGLLGAFVSSDRVLLAELALHGQFVEVPEPLFLHREHADRSVYRRPDHRSRELWFDPSRPRLSLPVWKLTAEMRRAISRAPLDWPERVRCHLLMTTWLRRHWLHLVKNPFGAVKHVLTSPRPERLELGG